MSTDDYDKLLGDVKKTMKRYALPRKAFARQLYAILEGKEVQEISDVKHQNVYRWTTGMTIPNARVAIAMQKWLADNK